MFFFFWRIVDTTDKTRLTAILFSCVASFSVVSTTPAHHRYWFIDVSKIYRFSPLYSKWLLDTVYGSRYYITCAMHVYWRTREKYEDRRRRGRRLPLHECTKLAYGERHSGAERYTYADATFVCQTRVRRGRTHAYTCRRKSVAVAVSHVTMT